MAIIVKVLSGRRPSSDLALAGFWVLVYGIIAILTLLGLVRQGFGYILYLAIPGIVVFAWHLWLVSHRSERRQAGVEVIATGVLSLTAPAAYWVGLKEYTPLGWWLWLLIWLQSAASIVYAYLRLDQRAHSEHRDLPKLWRQGSRAALYTSFNLIFATIIGLEGFVPRLIFVPYLLQWIETTWGIIHPASGWKATQIGIRQLIVSITWTILFIFFWRFQWTT